MNRFWTYIFTITCAAVLVSACNPLDVETPRNVRIENPDPELRPARTIALMWAIDGSSSMTNDTDMERTVEGAKAAMDFLDGRYDLAGVAWFNRDLYSIPLTQNMYEVGQTMESIQTTLEARLWDGAYLAVQELLHGNSRDVRSVILVTDGKDDGSNISLDSLGHFANLNRITIYTVGLGNVADSSSLDQLARWTDGLYYQYDTKDPDVEPLSVIFSDIIIDKMRQTP